MATTNAHASVTAKVNNGGTVVNAGNVASNSSITKVIAVKDLNTGTDYGSKIVEDTAGVDAGVTTADSGGTAGIAYFPNSQKGERNFIIRGAGDSAAKINNGASSLLKVGDRADQEYTGQMLNFSQKKLGTMTFNVLARPDGTNVNPGKSLSNDGDAQNYVQNDGSTAATSAASGPSRSVPGELTYMFGAKLPKQDDYKARDSRES
jgi:hypothetical protein